MIGKVVGKSHLLGIGLTAIKHTLGTVFMIIVPCFIIIALELIKIFGALGAEKKQKAAEEQARKDEEMEEFCRRLAELELAKMEATNDIAAEEGRAQRTEEEEQ